jgi:phosphotransacetylase
MARREAVVRRLERRLRDEVVGAEVRVAVPEAFSAIVAEGVRTYVEEYGGEVLLVGDESQIRAAADRIGWTLPAAVEIAAADVPEAGTLDAAATLVRAGAANGIVAGAIFASADVLRCALTFRLPGRRAGAGVVLVTAAGRVVVFADCAVMPDPGAKPLAALACDVADGFKVLIGERPRIALLSYLTKAETENPDVLKMRQAVSLVRALRPDLEVDGELQFDAAYDHEVAARKGASSPVAGRANTFIFPDLASANIGYKIAQYAGEAEFAFVFATGVYPPVINVSRGATPRVVARCLAVCAVLAAAGPPPKAVTRVQAPARATAQGGHQLR